MDTPRTNHQGQIDFLRMRDDLQDQLAADLLALHDATGISLDNWKNARAFVEQRIGGPITENGA